MNHGISYHIIPYIHLFIHSRLSNVWTKEDCGENNGSVPMIDEFHTSVYLHTQATSRPQFLPKSYSTNIITIVHSIGNVPAKYDKKDHGKDGNSDNQYTPRQFIILHVRLVRWCHVRGTVRRAVCSSIDVHHCRRHNACNVMTNLEMKRFWWEMLLLSVLD